jgi:hypothetical protein
LCQWNRLPEWRRPANNSTPAVVNFNVIQTVSQEVQRVLSKYCPEIVSLGRALTDRLLFVPVSATGQTPEKDPGSGDYMVRTSLIKSVWCEVPMIMSLYLSGTGLISGPGVEPHHSHSASGHALSAAPRGSSP